MQRCLRVAWGIVFIFAFSVQAETKIYGEQRVSGWWNWLKNDVSQTWNEPQNYDLYLPFLSWHNRFMYDKEKTDNYNEMPWGGGFGVSRYNQEGNWSSLYAMMFQGFAQRVAADYRLRLGEGLVS
ncbi:lipid A acylation protein PagP [Klebsiella grimontii]|uniref:Lipid A acylation protein PagP n=1 Tax=Klebsiella grimontii TaxID=2058152 RepID=A0A7H4P126_9ENTR|nr:lipid A acylation protein PagP [Klebsiella grimontii]